MARTTIRLTALYYDCDGYSRSKSFVGDDARERLDAWMAASEDPETEDWLPAEKGGYISKLRDVFRDEVILREEATEEQIAISEEERQRYYSIVGKENNRHRGDAKAA